MNTPSRPSTYSISELAKEFDITTRTIRFYEDKGLLTPQRKGQTRVYSPADRTKLKLILRGKRLGFSLEESRDIIEMYSPGQNNEQQLKALINHVRSRKATLQQQLHDIELMMLDLQESEQRCIDALQEMGVTDT
ncbi:MerR family DNA-binding transcriptional regulator [Aestuariirhabdus sp. Z084]|uniref:MerR family transcriptional regulator n=1 Tax=Aestuariirhabdus haliotis TaxID=2918751 RepID=UPI00201B3AEF|nr:MerR family DNA-binding transcriptional regulator [Aestuariirhabdus haliotis]MCL6415283.1 MerR family DNA-binding transcriptional regulator [Aestuariirhabdus haliotis]MCL6419543.1 MerR family DNA-binding transcriptional regulator [Aestuariirhabdus haliotis]